MPLLDDEAVGEFLAEHPQWSWADASITRTYEFDDFVTAMVFVNRVAEAAEAANHHPDIDVRWNKVTLTLSTHSAGGLTARDLDLAVVTDGLV